MYKMIIFGEDWGAHPSSTQHLAKYMQQSQDITWVNSVGMRAPSINKRDMLRVVNKLKMLLTTSSKKQKKQVTPPPFQVINPPVLPWHNSELINHFNRQQLAQAIGSRKPNEKRIYWLSLPTAISMIDIQPEDRVIYYCGDDFSALDGVDRAMIQRWEPKLIARANLILTASERLLSVMPKHKSKLLTHGVDYSLFSAATPAHPSIAPHRPTVGFYGSLSEWVNVELLAKLAKHRPHMDLMLVGQIKTDVESLRRLPNVQFVDAVEHRELPRFSQHWHALLMPFKLNQQIAACNPLKLREYLAAGQPIVSTYFPAVEQYQDLVAVADSHAEFIKAVDHAIEQSEFMRLVIQRRQRERVADHDWSLRAKTVGQYISAVL